MCITGLPRRRWWKLYYFINYQNFAIDTYSYEQNWVHFEQTHLQQTTTNNSQVFFSDLKIRYDIPQTCAHVCKISHHINSKKVRCKAKWETIYRYSILIKLPTKSLVIGLVTPTLQLNINSSWHALIKRNAIMFTKIGIHWTHTPTILGYLLEVL